MMKFTTSLFVVSALILSACAAQLVSDDKMKDAIGQSLNVPGNTLTVVSREPGSSPNVTYVNVIETSGQAFRCIVVGGTAASFGQIYPPSCSKPGDPQTVPGFAH